MTDSEKAFSRIKNNLPQYGTFDHGYQSTEDLIVVSNALQRAADCEKHQKFMQRVIDENVQARVDAREETRAIKDKMQVLIHALQIAKRDFKNWLTHEDAQEAAIAHIDKAIAAFEADETEGE